MITVAIVPTTPTTMPIICGVVRPEEDDDGDEDDIGDGVEPAVCDCIGGGCFRRRG